MFFNSLDFAIFLPIVLVLYWLSISRTKVQNLLLIAASYFFYGWWDWRFLSLIFFSSLVDYLVGLGMLGTTKPTRRKHLLFISLFVNLGFLGFFKYFNFFQTSFSDAFSLMGYPINSRGLEIILPVGISFYTFQTLSYSLDVYKKKLQPTKDGVAFFAFVSFFPQLVAGPIERATNLLPQFFCRREFLNQNFSRGFKLIILGFFLKLVVADRTAIYVNAVYNNIDNHQGLTFIVATVMFAFQIYGDFAGYSLIAIGTAKLFGFDLMTNFQRPYFSASISEFWSRWHISLSTWFRDYLYIALGGNRVKKPRWLVNLLLTFVISGLWHGANWTFVIWGALNGIYLILEVLFFKRIGNRIIRVISTFVLVNFAWIFFRAASVGDAVIIIKKFVLNPGRLYIGSGADVTALAYSLIAVFALVMVEIKREYFNSLFSFSDNRREIIRMLAYALVVFSILYLGVFGESQFIYFQF